MDSSSVGPSFRNELVQQINAFGLEQYHPRVSHPFSTQPWTEYPLEVRDYLNPSLDKVSATKAFEKEVSSLTLNDP